MAERKSRHQARGRGGEPDKEDVLAFIAEHGAELGKRELMHALGLKGKARTEAKRTMRAMRKAAGVKETGGYENDGLPAVGLADMVGIDEDGLPVLRAARDQEAEVRLAARSRIEPGIGDRFLARFSLLEDGSYRADPIKILPRRPREVVGVAEKTGSRWRLRPLGRNRGDEWELLLVPDVDLAHGDLVRAEADRSKSFGMPRATVSERLGHPDDPATVSLAVAVTARLPMQFDEKTLAEAAAAKPVGLGKRRDLRHFDLVTIDGEDARDFDDAVWAGPDEAPDNRGGHRLLVAIADVAHYVRPGSALDREAQERGNSVYFPDRVIPMLPEALSNDLCSLRPHEDRACLAVEMRIGPQGRLMDHRFVRGLMRSRARLTYEQVQAAFEGAADPVAEPILSTVIAPLYRAYEALAVARKRRGTIELDLSERRVRFDETGKPIAIEPRQRLSSNCLIEEFMIAANVAAARELGRRKQPLLYRVHDKPDALKLEALAQYLAELDIAWNRQSKKPGDFTQLIRSVKDHDLHDMIASFVLRAQAQAIYDPENRGHFGLNLQEYAHFTSPIRRYSDLVVHRALIYSLGLPGAGASTSGDDEGSLSKLGEHLSSTERRAMEAERKALQKFVTLLMADQVGACFEGRVISVHRFGMFVSLNESGAEGLVPVSSLGSDFFMHDERDHALVGRRTGERYGLGDRVEVELAAVDKVEGQLNFLIKNHYPARSGAKRTKRATTEHHGAKRTVYGKRRATSRRDSRSA